MCISKLGEYLFMKFNHVGIPVTHSFKGEIPLPHKES